MADPPQMEEPTPTRVEMFPGMCIALWSTHARISEMAMVLMIIGRDCPPVRRTTPRSMPKPSSTTAVCRMYLDVNLIPFFAFP